MGRQADIPAWHFPAAGGLRSHRRLPRQAVINQPCRCARLTRWSILLIFQDLIRLASCPPWKCGGLPAAKGSGLRGRRATAVTLTPRCAPSVTRIWGGQVREVERVGAADDDDSSRVFWGHAGFDAEYACACVSALARGNWTC